MTTTIFVFICKTDSSKPVKQEFNGTVILPPLVFPGSTVSDEEKKSLWHGHLDDQAAVDAPTALGAVDSPQARPEAAVS